MVYVRGMKTQTQMKEMRKKYESFQRELCGISVCVCFVGRNVDFSWVQWKAFCLVLEQSETKNNNSNSSSLAWAAEKRRNRYSIQIVIIHNYSNVSCIHTNKITPPRAPTLTTQIQSQCVHPILQKLILFCCLNFILFLQWLPLASLNILLLYDYSIVCKQTYFPIYEKKKWWQIFVVSG